MALTKVSYSMITGTPVNVMDFGAIGDGVTDDTSAIQAAINTGKDVFFPRPASYYKTTAALTPGSGQSLFGDGQSTQILCVGSNTNSVYISGSVTRCVVRDLFVKYTGTSSGGGNGAAVYIAAGASYCTVKNCRLEGVRAGVTITDANDNVIEDNLISLVTIPAPEGSWDIGVYLGGSRNRIANNQCFGGCYTGINLVSSATTSVDRNIVTGNHVSTHTGYGIVVYATTPGTANKNVVANNNVWDITGLFESVGNRSKGAGIYLASAEWTTVVGNVIENTNVDTDIQILAPGAIGILDCSCATVVGNVIKDPKWNGIYVVNNGSITSSIIITGNVITNPVKRGIFINNTNNISLIGNSIDGSTQEAGILYQHSGIGTGITIQSNRVTSCDVDAALRITDAQSPIIANNYFGNCLNGLIAGDLSGAIFTGNEFRNNTSNDAYIDSTCTGQILFDKNVVKGSGVNGLNDLYGITWGQNDIGGQTNPYAIGSIKQERRLAASATPSVRGSRFADTGVGVLPNITDLLNPVEGQIITIICNTAVVLEHNTGSATTKLILAGGVNFTMAANDTITLLYRDGGPWIEIARQV